MAQDNAHGAYASESGNSPANGTSHAAPMENVEGKVAFITGGDSGIGLGVARALADAGMKIAITYRSKDHLDHAMKILASAADRVHAVHVDVTDRAAMAAAAEETVRVFGKVHVLVNNAGVIPIVSLCNATFDDWDWCMRVNVSGVFNGIRAFLPHIKKHGEGGHIIATSSIDGLVIGRLTLGVYATSKFAVVGMMEALRTELADTNVGVSVFCPGGVNTDIANCHRNRPTELAEKGALNAEELAVRKEFGGTVRKLVEENAGTTPLMDPLEAGERVLQGIRNNDFYILSHSEFEQAIRDRNAALLASIRSASAPPTQARIAVARMMRNSMYINESHRQIAVADRTG